LVAISSIVAVMEPFSTVAVFMTLTKSMDSEKKKKVISKSMRISLLVLVFFAITGHLVFRVFNITVAAFQIAGGILLITVALEMLRPGKGELSVSGSEDIAIVPMAFPLTSGPGAITAVILLTSQSTGITESSFIFVGIIIAVLLSYISLKYSHLLFRWLGDDGLRVVTALMAIIVLAIAVQFIINGIADAMTEISASKSLAQVAFIAASGSI